MKKFEYVKMKDVTQAMTDTFNEAGLPYDPSHYFAHLSKLLDDMPTVKMEEGAFDGTVELNKKRYEELVSESTQLAILEKAYKGMKSYEFDNFVKVLFEEKEETC
nr:MAG TPA: hypothetical protein [Caudoviricetes sp.]